MADVSGIFNTQSRTGQTSPGGSRRRGLHSPAPPFRIIDIFTSIDQSHRDVAQQIEEVWEIIGLPESARQERIDVFQRKQRELVGEVLDAALELQLQYKGELEESIQCYSLEIPSLEELLDHSTGGLEVPSGLTVLETEDVLRLRLNTLSELKMERKGMRNYLLETNLQYAAVLGVDAVVVGDDTDRYKLAFMDKIASINQSLENLVKARSADMAVLRDRIENVQKEMDIEDVDIDWKILSEENLAYGHNLLEKLLEQRAKNLDEGRVLSERILHLCKRYSLTSPLIDSLSGTFPKLASGTVIDQLNTEKDRLETLGRDKAEGVVRDLRMRIDNLWNTLFWSPKERAKFAPYNAGEFDEQLITEHENYLKDLGDEYDDNRRLFDMLSNRRALLHKIELLQEEESKPESKKNRGGILLKIQGEKATVQKEATKELSAIRAAVEARSQQKGSPYTIGGLLLDDFLAKENLVNGKEKWTRHRDTGSPVKRLQNAPLSSSAKRLRKDVLIANSGGCTTKNAKNLTVNDRINRQLNFSGTSATSGSKHK